MSRSSVESSKPDLLVLRGSLESGGRKGVRDLLGLLDLLENEVLRGYTGSQAQAVPEENPVPLALLVHEALKGILAFQVIGGSWECKGSLESVGIAGSLESWVRWGQMGRVRLVLKVLLA